MFDDCQQGDWKGSSIQPTLLEDRLEGETDIEMFLDFIRSMLNWVPEKRKTAAELAMHHFGLTPTRDCGKGGRRLDGGKSEDSWWLSIPLTTRDS